MQFWVHINFYLQNSMDVLGFESGDKKNIYKVVAAVMHFGTMKFKQRGREEQAEADGSKVSSTDQWSRIVSHYSLKDFPWDDTYFFQGRRYGGQASRC